MKNKTHTPIWAMYLTALIASIVGAIFGGDHLLLTIALVVVISLAATPRMYSYVQPKLEEDEVVWLCTCRNAGVVKMDTSDETQAMLLSYQVYLQHVFVSPKCNENPEIVKISKSLAELPIWAQPMVRRALIQRRAEAKRR